MHTGQPKKLLIISILDILKKYSDEDHRLSQKDIANILERDYGMSADRKAIRRNLIGLMECGYNIEYTETVRNVPNAKTGESEESYIWTDFYLERPFTDGELRLLIDSLLFSQHIPPSQCRELVGKLEGLSNTYFRARIKHISRPSDAKENNRQIFLNIELLDEAISRGRKVAFKYLEYDTDKRLHAKKQKNGKDRIYVVSPYQMAAREGKYFLICNNDHYNDISNYRIDRIADLRVLDEPTKPFETLRPANGQALDLAEYMARHPYMYSSENVRVKFRIPTAMISDIIDTFGGDVVFSDSDASGVTVSTVTNEKAMEQFAKSFAPDVILLEPEALKNKIKSDLEKTLEKYE